MDVIHSTLQTFNTGCNSFNTATCSSSSPIQFSTLALLLEVEWKHYHWAISFTLILIPNSKLSYPFDFGLSKIKLISH